MLQNADCSKVCRITLHHKKCNFITNKISFPEYVRQPWRLKTNSHKLAQFSLLATDQFYGTSWIIYNFFVCRLIHREPYKKFKKIWAMLTMLFERPRQSISRYYHWQVTSSWNQYESNENVNLSLHSLWSNDGKCKTQRDVWFQQAEFV